VLVGEEAGSRDLDVVEASRAEFLLEVRPHHR
jgi:hypothetical protein